MSRKQIICLCAVLGLLASCEERWVLGASASEYTARALIIVLPYADKDPMRIETPAIDKDIQCGFRQSIATLVKRQSTLQELIVTNTNASAQFIQIFDSATVPADTTVPDRMFKVAAGTTVSYAPLGGVNMTNGIAVSNSSTAATKTIGAADCWFEGYYSP